MPGVRKPKAQGRLHKPDGLPEVRLPERGLRDFDDGTRVRIQTYEEMCIVPGCQDDGDHKYRGPTGYYCTLHGRTVSRHEAPKNTAKLIGSQSINNG